MFHRVGRRLATALVVAAACCVVAAQPAAGQTNPCSSPTRTLANAKLCEEIRKLQLENAGSTGWRGSLTEVAGLAGVLSAVGAFVGVLLTFRSQRRQQAQQRVADHDQREAESQRLLDARFSSILGDLGAKSEAVQAGAAVSLLGFVDALHLEDEPRAAFNHRARLAALANLKVSHTPTICKLLTRVLEAALRTSEPLEPAERDLSHAFLPRADLSELDLTSADVAFADLHEANLTNATLYRARGREADLTGARVCGKDTDLREIRFRKASAERADFRESNLRAAHLEEAILNGAKFQQARLQSAHLDNAELTGASFQQANLNDTYFTGATLDDATLQSITRGVNWQKAHFSPADKERLDALVAAHGGS